MNSFLKIKFFKKRYLWFLVWTICMWIFSVYNFIALLTKNMYEGELFFLLYKKSYQTRSLILLVMQFSHSPLKVNTALYCREIVARCNTQFIHIPTAAETIETRAATQLISLGLWIACQFRIEFVLTFSEMLVRFVILLAVLELDNIIYEHLLPDILAINSTIGKACPVLPIEVVSLCW